MDWKWDSVLSPDITKDAGPNIHYYVLFVPKEIINEIWYQVSNLTKMSELGYRSAVSPTEMTYGDFQGHYTIIVEAPERLMHRAWRKMKNYGLSKFVENQKVRVRYQQEEDTMPFDEYYY